MSPFEDLATRYGWIWIGLLFGVSAKYALLIKRRVRIRLYLVLADLLLLPMVALIAYTMAVRTGAAGEIAALMSAFCAVGADRLVKMLTERFFRAVETEVENASNRVRGNMRNEVQTVQSGESIIDDTMKGNAPTDYVALRPHKEPRK